MFVKLALTLLGRRNAWRIGRSLYMAARDERGNAIASNGESELIRRMVAAHKPGSSNVPFRAFDIGANLGEWTQVLLDALGSRPAEIDVFEPVPATSDKLAQRFEGETRVKVCRKAVSDTTGRATMFIVGETAGTNSLVRTHEGKSEVEVELIRFDDQLEATGADYIDLVKMDAEGHDIVILRSLSAALQRRAIGVVQFEYNWRWLPSRGSLWEVFEIVKDLDYEVARVSPAGLLVYDRWNIELDRVIEANYALVRRDLIDPLRATRFDWDKSNLPVAQRAG